MDDPLLTREAIEDLESPLAARVELHEQIGSTQERARDLARDGAPHGTLVVAKVQKGGRGRLGRAWGSPPGGLWMSLVLRPDLPARLAPRVTQTAAVGVARALRSFGVQARIKWPNDLLILAEPDDPTGRKICGILAESGGLPPDHFIVLGVGLNANLDPESLPEVEGRGVATVRSVLGRDLDLAELLETVLSCLDRELGRMRDFAAILDDWRALNCTLGKRVRVQRFGEVIEGRAAGLDPEGALLVETRSGTATVFEGEVEHLRHEGA